MNRIPRILPLIGVAAGGVLAINALGGAKTQPGMVSGARAWAEGAVGAQKPAAKPEDKPQAASAADAAKPVAAVAPAKPPAPVCAPTAAELAKEAGLSPAELRVLQSLGARRNELDGREKDIDLQMQLLAAAEAKLDAKIKTMNGLKGEIQGLLGQADAKADAEADRLVTVYSAMKPKDAAARMSLLDDSVRLPIAAKMKERVLSGVLAQMAPQDARDLTEKLAHRLSKAQSVLQAKAALAPVAAAAPAAASPQAQAQAPAAASPAAAKAKAR